MAWPGLTWLGSVSLSTGVFHAQFHAWIQNICQRTVHLSTSSRFLTAVEVRTEPWLHSFRTEICSRVFHLKHLSLTLFVGIKFFANFDVFICFWLCVCVCVLFCASIGGCVIMMMVNSFWIVKISCTANFYHFMNANQMRYIRLACIPAISLLMQLVLLLLLLFMYRMCRGTNDRKKCGEKRKKTPFSNTLRGKPT